MIKYIMRLFQHTCPAGRDIASTCAYGPGYAATHSNRLISTQLTAERWQKQHFGGIMDAWNQSASFKRSSCAKEALSSAQKEPQQRDINWKRMNTSCFKIQNVCALYISRIINVTWPSQVATGTRINGRQSLHFKKNVWRSTWFLLRNL